MLDRKARIILALFTMLFSVASISSCGKKEGCTDRFASNFNSDADEDDGSCEYLGCTDPVSLNYDPNAREDDGSCEYPGEIWFYSNRQLGNGRFISVLLNNSFAGNLQITCPDQFVDCSVTTCGKLTVSELDPGVYNYRGWVIDQIGVSQFDTIQEVTPGSITVNSSSCNAIIL